MKNELKALLKDILCGMGVPDSDPSVEIPDNPEFGEYTTNVALKVAGVLKKSPMDVALQVKDKLTMLSSQFIAGELDHNTSNASQSLSREWSGKDVLRAIDRVEVVKPGFINVFLTEAKLSTQIGEALKQENTYGTVQTERLPKVRHDGGLEKYAPAGFPPVSAGKLAHSGEPKRIMVEFAHPNTHKAFHIGHLRNITTGETVVRLLEAVGHTVVRANYQGDVGMHIAKCLYGILQSQNSNLKTQNWQDMATKSIQERAAYLGQMYAAGSKAYEEEEDAKKAIGEINKKIYAKDPDIYPIYTETREWSLEYFQAIYKRVGTVYDRYYFESEVFDSGRKTVEDGLRRGIFAESDSAVIFPGEKFGLHNRVFITQEGNPTYEGKEMGLGPLQFSEYHPDLIMHCVSQEQTGYFQVCFEAMAQLFPVTRGREYHLEYGWVRLKHGKMSSRTGNVVLGEWLIEEVKKTIYNKILSNISKDIEIDREEVAEKAAIAAVKYAFLKTGLTSETIFDIEESVNINGDSGVYLLYAYARCKSVLRKAQNTDSNFPKENDFVHWLLESISDFDFGTWKLNPEEHAVARLIALYPDIVRYAGTRLVPNSICAYLFDLSQAFNLFYQKHQIIASRDLKTAITGNGEKSVTGPEDGTSDNQLESRQQSNNQTIQQSDESFRLTLTAATAQVLKNGLELLGIQTVERM